MTQLLFTLNAIKIICIFVSFAIGIFSLVHFIQKISNSTKNIVIISIYSVSIFVAGLSVVLGYISLKQNSTTGFMMTNNNLGFLIFKLLLDFLNIGLLIALIVILFKFSNFGVDDEKTVKTLKILALVQLGIISITTLILLIPLIVSVSNYYVKNNKIKAFEHELDAHAREEFFSIFDCIEPDGGYSTSLEVTRHSYILTNYPDVLAIIYAGKSIRFNKSLDLLNLIGNSSENLKTILGRNGYFMIGLIVAIINFKKSFVEFCKKESFFLFKIHASAKGNYTMTSSDIDEILDKFYDYFIQDFHNSFSRILSSRPEYKSNESMAGPAETSADRSVGSVLGSDEGNIDLLNNYCGDNGVFDYFEGSTCREKFSNVWGELNKHLDEIKIFFGPGGANYIWSFGSLDFYFKNQYFLTDLGYIFGYKSIFNKFRRFIKSNPNKILKLYSMAVSQDVIDSVKLIRDSFWPVHTPLSFRLTMQDPIYDLDRDFEAEFN